MVDCAPGHWTVQVARIEVDPKPWVVRKPVLETIVAAAVFVESHERPTLWVRS